LTVASPHKQAAAALAAELTPRATRAAAANTLSQRGESIIGDNTDGAGLVRDLRDNLGIDLAGKSLLILGAGGATRGVLAPLLALDPRIIVIANRTLDRAQLLAMQFADLGSIRACSFADLEPHAVDVIINATAAGVAGSMPSLDARIVGPHTVCYDFAYGRGSTPFTLWAQQHGCAQAVKGWGMQVEQAAESFQLWHGVRPETASVIAILAADTH
jgi:shikimate dehydrogenase